ncbi:MAG: SulP family inorganic anion transporter, partial [Betaproteobacteria bacterium]|nr:SulP family inorganic anion transporter [Betaproteobacteria bacterium]
LAGLAAILIFVAWNMGEWRAFVHLRQYRLPYRIILLAVFFLTVVVDLTVAVEVGLIGACLTFIFRISSLSHSETLSAHELPGLAGLQGQVTAIRLYGAVFFGAVKLIEAIENQLPTRAVILDLKNVIYIDSSGVDALIALAHLCQKRKVRLMLCGLLNQPQDIAKRSGLLDLPSTDLALDLQESLARTSPGAVNGKIPH